AARTSTSAWRPRWPAARRREIRPESPSSSGSLCLNVLIVDDRDEQLGDAGLAHVAQFGKLLTIDVMEQQHAAAEHLALLDRLELPCRGDLFRSYGDFGIARLELLHAALEHDPGVVDE